MIWALFNRVAEIAGEREKKKIMAPLSIETIALYIYNKHTPQSIPVPLVPTKKKKDYYEPALNTCSITASS